MKSVDESSVPKLNFKILLDNLSCLSQNDDYVFLSFV